MRVKLYVFSTMGLFGAVLGTSGACFDNDSCLEDGSCYSSTTPELDPDAAPGPDQDANVGSEQDPAKVEICVNGIDDDGDDKFDCADEDCANSLPCMRQEECTNGIDDDFNAQVDCADDACTNLARCEETPNGSMGFYRIRILENGEDTTACAAGDQPTSFFKGSPEAQCEECRCAGSCENPLMQCVDTWNGSSPTIWVKFNDTETCRPGNGETYSRSSCTIAAPKSSSQCSPVGGGRQPPGDLDKRIDACLARATPDAGCGDNKVCVEKNDADGALCVMNSGNHECSGAWPDKHLAYRSQRDTRACKCDCSRGPCNGGGYVVFDKNDCNPGSNDRAVFAGVTADTTNQLDNRQFSFGKIPPIATCTPNGSKEGTFKDSTLVTFCCK